MDLTLGEYQSKRMLELMQTGIIDYWDLWFRPMPLQCLDNIKSVYKPQNSKTLKMKNRPPALTLKNLTGAFIVLALGFSLSFLAFLCEQIISILTRRSRQLQKSRSNTANSRLEKARSNTGRSGEMNQELAVNVEVELNTLSNEINTQEEPANDVEIGSVNLCVEMIKNQSTDNEINTQEEPAIDIEIGFV
jgi:hypothetical protein